MNWEKVLLIVFILGILVINYSYLDSLLIKSFDSSEYGKVQRIVDGDTIIVNDYSIRLLGINSPEKGEIGYGQAKDFLNETILNKEVKLVFGKNEFDLYKRKLAYVFLGKRNINSESVKNGYSNFYFPEGKDNYYESFKSAWENCLDKNINICEKSENKCLVLKEWNIKSQRVILKNICENSLNLKDWSIKDEGRKKYTFQNTVLNSGDEIALFPSDWNVTYVWTSTGDSIFIRDKEGKLVFWDSY